MPRLPASALAVALAGSLLAASAPSEAVQEFPKLRSGLWTTTTSVAGRTSAEPRTATLCLDDSVQQEMYRMSVGVMAGMCSKHDIKVAGSKVTTEAVCDLGGTKMQSSSVMTLTGDTAYRTETRATFDPPWNGTRESTTVIEGKHVGACKAGQKPGDMTLPNGQNLNIRQWMGAPKG